MINRVCQTCSKDFKAYPYSVRNGNARFCSLICRNPAIKIKRICLTCTKEFNARPCFIKKGNARFCSISCRPKHSEEIKRKISENSARIWLGVKMSQETKQKISQSKKGQNSGENHYGWIGDRSLLKRHDERNDSAYQNWSRTVKLRDNWICQFMNENCKGMKIAHHILPWRDYPEERYNINNGITLCQYHHPRKRVEEKKLMPILQELIGLKKF